MFQCQFRSNYINPFEDTMCGGLYECVSCANDEWVRPDHLQRYLNKLRNVSYLEKYANTVTRIQK